TRWFFVMAFSQAFPLRRAPRCTAPRSPLAPRSQVLTLPLLLRRFLRASASKSRVAKHPSHRHTEPNCEYPRRRAECILRAAWVNPTPTPTPEVDFTTSMNESSVVRLVLKICWLLVHAW